MKTQTQTIVNGVNVSQLFETIDNIKENTEIAKFNFRATNKWIDGTENHTTVGDFYGACKTHTRETPHTFIKDEPEILLGKDKGANPVEYLLAGLAGCITLFEFKSGNTGEQVDSARWLTELHYVTWT